MVRILSFHNPPHSLNNFLIQETFYRWFVDSGFQVILSPANNEHLSLYYSGYSFNIQSDSPCQQSSATAVYTRVDPCDKMKACEHILTIYDSALCTRSIRGTLEQTLARHLKSHAPRSTCISSR